MRKNVLLSLMTWALLGSTLHATEQSYRTSPFSLALRAYRGQIPGIPAGRTLCQSGVKGEDVVRAAVHEARPGSGIDEQTLEDSAYVRSVDQQLQGLCRSGGR